MTKLTNAMRAKTVDALIDYRFGERIKALHAELADIAQTARGHYFGNFEMSLDDVPEDWVGNQFYITCNFGGEIAHLNFNGTLTPYVSDSNHFDRGVKSVSLRAPCQGFGRQNYTADAPLTARWRLASAEHAALEQDLVKARSDARAALAAFTTTEALTEAWPEIAPFLPEPPKPAKPSLPALTRDALNSVFKLPIEEKQTC